MFLDFFSLFKGITQGISQKGKRKPKKPKETKAGHLSYSK